MTTTVIFQCHACKHTMEEWPQVCPQCGSVDIHVLMALSRDGIVPRFVVQQREAREKLARWNSKVKPSDIGTV